MKVLIGCESSGHTREAFRALGHDAWSCDLLPADDGSKYHFQQDVFEVAESAAWDLAIFHPPCTYLTSSGLHWNKRVPGRAEKTLEALDFVRALMGVSIPRWCIENPAGAIGTNIRKADQFIQPYQFGDDASKKTGLWLHGLPLLQPLPRQLWAPPRVVFDKNLGRMADRWSNQTDSGQNKLAPSEDRWKERSVTYPGIARAFAEQWG
jgi:hypothetical protein